MAIKMFGWQCDHCGSIWLESYRQRIKICLWCKKPPAWKPINVFKPVKMDLEAADRLEAEHWESLRKEVKSSGEDPKG